MKKVKRFFLGLIILILITEIGLRVFFEDRLRIRQLPLNYMPDSLLGYKYIPDSEDELKWVGINRKFKFNNLGYYGSDFTKTKKEGTYRICIIGSSVANGIWTNSDKDYSIYLQELFINVGYNKVEIINCAIDGGRRFYQEINMANYVLKNFDSDLILFENSLDVKLRFYSRENYRGYQLRYPTFSEKAKSISKTEIDKMFNFEYKCLKNIYDWSYIVRFTSRSLGYSETMTNEFKNDLKTLIRKEDNTQNHIVYYFTLDSYIDLLKKLNDDLKLSGKKLILLNYNNNLSLQNIAQSNSISVISLKLNLSRYSMKYDGHPTQEGHKVIAQELYGKLLENNFIPIQYLGSK